MVHLKIDEFFISQSVFFNVNFQDFDTLEVFNLFY